MEHINKNGLDTLQFANIKPELLKKVQSLENEINKESNTSSIILMALNNTEKY